MVFRLNAGVAEKKQAADEDRPAAAHLGKGAARRSAVAVLHLRAAAAAGDGAGGLGATSLQMQRRRRLPRLRLLLLLLLLLLLRHLGLPVRANKKKASYYSSMPPRRDPTSRKKQEDEDTYLGRGISAAPSSEPYPAAARCGLQRELKFVVQRQKQSGGGEGGRSVGAILIATRTAKIRRSRFPKNANVWEQKNKRSELDGLQELVGGITKKFTTISIYFVLHECDKFTRFNCS